MAISPTEQRKLFARSGNRCAFTDCRRVLTADGSPPDQIVILGEVAHIVAERPDGPRGDDRIPLEERNRADNLVLLCNVHHQLIDSQPATYGVQRLLAMKESHEKWVEQTLNRGGGESAVRPPALSVSEVVHSSVLPVEHMPRFVYGVPCLRSEHQVQELLRAPRSGEMAPFIIEGQMLYAFQDLSATGNLFEEVARGEPVERFQVQEWWSDPDQSRWFSQLLNRTLNKLTGRLGLHLDREHRRYYFPLGDLGQPVSIAYKSLTGRNSSRGVVWQPKRRSTGEPRPYWYHRAVALQFMRSGSQTWILTLRPELRITEDGIKPYKSRNVGGRVTRKKSRTFNYDLLGEVHFWRDFLSRSQPRIILPFGSGGQDIIVSSTLMQGDVVWPGIPSEFAKPFTNVEYLDDLFSWAELNSLDDDLAEDDDWLLDDDEIGGDDGGG